MLLNLTREDGHPVLVETASIINVEAIRRTNARVSRQPISGIAREGKACSKLLMVCNPDLRVQEDIREIARKAEPVINSTTIGVFLGILGFISGTLIMIAGKL